VAEWVQRLANVGRIGATSSAVVAIVPSSAVVAIIPSSIIVPISSFISGTSAIVIAPSAISWRRRATASWRSSWRMSASRRGRTTASWRTGMAIVSTGHI